VKNGPLKDKDNPFSFEKPIYLDELDEEDLRAARRIQFHSNKLAKEHAEFLVKIESYLESADEIEKEETKFLMEFWSDFYMRFWFQKWYLA
jgi:hypothetical protein